MLKPTTAFLGSIYIGTNRLERWLTDAEQRDLALLLRRHDFVGASLVSLRYAYRLRRNEAAAHDLQGRANVRLVRQGWDPGAVTLVKCLCRFVWSEHTHAKRESEAARRAEMAFLGEQAVDHGDTAPSAEDLRTRLQAERVEEEGATKRVASLRTAFVKARDTTNLLWLGYQLEGVDKPSEMARLSGHDVRAFYRATDRRKKHTAGLLDAERGAQSKEKK